MAYADYEFYKNEYYGNLISEEAFERLISKASDKLDYLSNYRVPRYIDSIVTEDTRDVVLKKLIAKATCYIAEQLYDIDIALQIKRQSAGLEETNMGLRGKVITNISSGGESVSFSNAITGNISEYVDNPKRLNRYLFDGIREYLGGSGLISQAL